MAKYSPEILKELPNVWCMFSASIFNNPDRRMAKLNHLQHLRKETNELNIFANKQIEDAVSRFNDEKKGEVYEMKKFLESLQLWGEIREYSSLYLGEILKLEVLFSSKESVSREEILSIHEKILIRNNANNDRLKTLVTEYNRQFEEKFRNNKFLGVFGYDYDENRYHESIEKGLTPIIQNTYDPKSLAQSINAIESPTEVIVDENGDYYYQVEGRDS